MSLCMWNRVTDRVAVYLALDKRERELVDPRSGPERSLLEKDTLINSRGSLTPAANRSWPARSSVRWNFEAKRYTSNTTTKFCTLFGEHMTTNIIHEVLSDIHWTRIYKTRGSVEIHNPRLRKTSRH